MARRQGLNQELAVVKAHQPITSDAASMNRDSLIILTETTPMRPHFGQGAVAVVAWPVQICPSMRNPTGTVV